MSQNLLGGIQIVKPNIVELYYMMCEYISICSSSGIAIPDQAIITNTLQQYSSCSNDDIISSIGKDRATQRILVVGLYYAMTRSSSGSGGGSGSGSVSSSGSITTNGHRHFISGKCVILSLGKCSVV